MDPERLIISITSGSFCCAGSVGLSCSLAVGLVEPAHWPPADHQLQSVKKRQKP